MKANAPEKIYIDDPTGEFDDHWSICQNNDSIEYTRTDVFIKKAEKFFTEKFEVEDYNTNIDIDGSPIFNYGRFIDDFEEYLKK
jgi:hypothetical protein